MTTPYEHSYAEKLGLEYAKLFGETEKAKNEYYNAIAIENKNEITERDAQLKQERIQFCEYFIDQYSKLKEENPSFNNDLIYSLVIDSWKNQ